MTIYYDYRIYFILFHSIARKKNFELKGSVENEVIKSRLCALLLHKYMAFGELLFVALLFYHENQYYIAVCVYAEQLYGVMSVFCTTLQKLFTIS